MPDGFPSPPAVVPGVLFLCARIRITGPLSLTLGRGPRAATFLASDVHPFATLDELRALTMPVRILAGTDPEHPAEVARLLASVIPGATLGSPGEDVPRAVAHFSAKARS